jgi:hypothetical protein
MTYVNNSFTFFSRLSTSNFSSIPTVFHRFFTWIALGYGDLHFSLMFVTKVIVAEEETQRATWLCHQLNQPIHMTDDVTVISLSASLLQKINAAIDRIQHSTLNWKLSHKFLSVVNFEVTLKQNHTKRNLVKQDLPVLKKSHLQFQYYCPFQKFSQITWVRTCTHFIQWL